MKNFFKVLAAIGATCFVLMIVAVTFAMLGSVASQSGGRISGDTVAVVDVKGVIWDATDFLKQLKSLEDNDSVKAVVVRIDSPGGLVAPSQEIYRALRALDEKIPVVASMASVAASGGYYSAIGARKIYANRGTLTASIGVIMEFVNNARLYEWAKMKRYTLKAGKFKDVGSSLRDMSPAERKLMQGMINSIHRDFKDAVKERRNLKEEQILNSTDGRIMTGSQAVKAGLVDVLGGLNDAVASAKEEAGLDPEANVYYPEEEEALLKKVLLGKWGSLLRGLGFQTANMPINTGWQILLMPSGLY